MSEPRQIDPRRLVWLECCCCSGDAGRWNQWHNRDNGYGMCMPCIESCREDGMSEAEILSNYGREGINWGAR